jgi:hypothetical protein
MAEFEGLEDLGGDQAAAPQDGIDFDGAGK